MGQPVVHFEIIGRDAGRLTAFYSSLFGWNIDADNPMQYGVVDRKQNQNADGIGIGGGIGALPDVPSYVTVYIEVPDVEAALDSASNLGGARVMGPEKVMEGVEIGIFTDPEGHLIGVIKAAG
jgi:predicted enzyme related to lactoylglutathione lyase